LNAGRAEAKKAYDEVTKTIGETESIANAKKSGTPTVDARGQVLKLFSLPKKAKGTEFEGPKPLEAPQGEAAQNEPSQAQTAETPKPEFRGNTYLTGQGRLVTAIGEPGENKQVRVRETREGGDYIFYTPVRSLRQVNEGTEKVFGDIVYEHQYDPGTEIVTQTPEGVPENRNTTDKMGEIYFSRRGERQHFSAIMGDGTEVNPIIATPKSGGDPFVILRSQNSADAEAMIEQNLGMKPEDVTLRNVNENDLRSFLSNKPLEQEQQNANAGSPKGGIEKTGEQGSLPEHQGESPGTAAPENSGEIRGEESSRSGRGGSGKRGTQQKQTEEGQVESLSARRKRAKDIAAVLSEPPQSPAEAAMHFILGGGRFNLFDVRKQALGSNAKPVAGGDIGPEYLHIANNKGTSIDRFVHDIMPEYLGREQGDIDEVNARNEILDMLTTVRSQSDIIGKVREFRAQNQPPEWAEEQRRRDEDPAYKAFAEGIDRLSTKQTEENLGQPAVLEPEGEELAFERSSKGKQRPLKYLANARSLTGEELIGEIDAGGKVYDQMVKAAKTGDENALMKLSDEIYNETKNFFDNIETKSYKEGAKKPIAYSRGTPERTTHFSEIYDKYIDPSYRLTEQEFNDVKKTKGFKLAASQGGQDYSDYIMTNLRRLRDIQILLDLPKERQLQYAELTSKEFSDEARHLYYSQPESEDISYEKGSRIPPGGKTKQGKGYKITEIDPFEDPAGYAEERAKYNPREYKFGEKVYRYDPEGGVLQAPELGTIKRATIMGAEVPAFVSEDTKKASLIDENVMRRGEAHPLTRLGQYPIDAQTATDDVTHVPTDADNMISPLIHNFAEEIAAAYGGDVNFKLFRNNKALGFLSHRPPKSEFGTPTVALDRRIFADPNLVARVLTHEIGHLDDYSGPDTFTTKRGTLLDRIKTLKAPTAEIGITNKALRQELVNLTNKWKPFDPAANADYTAYRYKAAELYADFVSATILDPKFAMEVAPGFSQEYFKKMDERPVVKEAYEQMRANLDPTTDTFQEASLARTRAAMAEGKVRLAEKRYDEREAAKGVRGSLLPQGDYKTTQAFNFFEPVNRLAAEREATAYKMLKNAGLKKEYAEFVRLHNLKERNAADPVSLASAIAEQETRLGDAKMEKLWKARSLLDNFSMGFHAARFAVQDYRLSNESKAAIADDFDGFLDKARALGVEEDVGIYLKNTAITGTHRAGVAQPNLETPESAARQLAYMKKSLGEEKYAAIEQAASDIRASQFEELQAFAKSGLISEEKLKELSANKDSYAKFQAVLSDEISAHYSREGVKGMLTETHDPALTALLQQMSMRQAILTNEAKKASIGLIKEAEDVRKFSRQFGRGRHSALPTIEEAPVRKMDAITREERYAKPPRGHDVLEVYEGGKRKGYIVDQYMADIFNKAPYSVERNWDWWTNYLKFQRGVFITYNPNFTFQNFFRDAGKGLASTGFGIVKNYPEATRASYRMTKGIVDPMADEAARAGVLNYSNRSNWENEFGGRIQPIDKVLRTPEERRGAFMRTTRALGHLAENYTPIGVMRTVLETTEGSHKIAAYNTFLQQGFSSREAAYMSRLHVGTPDGSISGFLSNRLNRTFMFTKMTMNAWMSDFELVRNPYTRAGFVARSMLTTIIPRTLQFMAAKGMLTVLASAAFGDDDQKTQYFRDVENEFADIPSYDLSNYQIVPLGLISNNIGHFKGEQGKSMRRYLRFATDQNITTAAASVQRAIGAIADGRSWDAVREIASQSYGDLPGMTPLLDASWSWMEYLFNQKNPYDNFRNKNVISDQAMQASQGLAGPAKNELARWTLEKLLGTTYQTLYRGPKRLIEQYTHPDSISSEPLRIMGYSEAEAGVTERKAAIEGAARESAATSYETKQILRRGDPEEIAKAREQGVVTEKQFTDFLKTTAEAPDEKKLKQLSVQQVQELTKVALHRRDTSYVQILGPILGQKMQNFQEHPEKYTEKTKKTVFENDSVLNRLYLQYQNSLRQGGGR
jgi:hypothetical protein